MNEAQEAAWKRLVATVNAISEWVCDESATPEAALSLIEERHAAELECEQTGFNAFQITEIKRYPHNFRPTF